MINKKQFAYTVFVTLLILIIGGCSYKNISTTNSDNNYVQSVLYFGLASPKGKVTEKQWDSFLKTYVTPKFPKGFTVISGYGQWEEDSGEIVGQESKILIIFHKNTEKTDKFINEIRSEYKTLFDQESVMLETNYVTISF